MAVRLAVKYTPYDMFSKEQTGDVITFAQFEEGNLLPETRNNTESGDKSDSESIMMSEQYMEKSQQSRSMGHSAPFGSSLTIYLGHYMSVTY